MVYNKNTNSLKYNGRPIQSIRLNGKPFFDGNIQTVLERLPTFYIDKINIYQSKKMMIHIADRIIYLFWI